MGIVFGLLTAVLTVALRILFDVSGFFQIVGCILVAFCILVWAATLLEKIIDLIKRDGDGMPDGSFPADAIIIRVCVTVSGIIGLFMSGIASKLIDMIF